MITDYIENKGRHNAYKKGVAIEKSHWDVLYKNILPKESITLADDWESAVIKGRGWTKYGREMYSPSLKKMRHQNILEFYGTSIVD